MTADKKNQDIFNPSQPVFGFTAEGSSDFQDDQRLIVRNKSLTKNPLPKLLIDQAEERYTWDNPIFGVVKSSFITGENPWRHPGEIPNCEVDFTGECVG